MTQAERDRAGMDTAAIIESLQIAGLRIREHRYDEAQAAILDGLRVARRHRDRLRNQPQAKQTVGDVLAGW